MSFKTFTKKLNNNLLLYFSGQTRIAHKIVKNFKKKLNYSKKDNIFQILKTVQEAKKILLNEKLDDFGYLLDETWNYKKGLSRDISNTEIDLIYKKAKSHGALGGKLLGAGGGGFLLFYVPKSKQHEFKKKMNFLLNIPFKFSNNGSEIIFRSK